MRLSLQLFTVRDAMGTDLEGTLHAIKAMGLEYVELAGLYGKSADEFATILANIGLQVSGSHVGIEALEQKFDEVVAENRALGNRWVIVPYIPEDRRNWGELAATLNGLGSQLAKEDMRLAYHNHDFELGADDGLRQLIAWTDSDLVWFQIDLGWVRFAGQDPANFLADLGPRAPLVHLKDMLSGANNPHVVAGNGSVDWKAILAASSAVEFGAIEMDIPPTDPITDVRTCVDFFRNLGLS